MHINKTHFINLLLNGGSHALTLIVMFFITPFIVGGLDPVAYGIWSLLNVLVGHMGLLDLGVRASVGRHIALYLGKKDEAGVDETVRTGLGFFSLVGILLLIVASIIGSLFPDIFKNVPTDYHRTLIFLLLVMVFKVWMSAISAIYSSVLAAHNRFDLARLSDITALIVRTGCVIFVISTGKGLWGLVISETIGGMTSFVFNYFQANMQQKNLKPWPFVFSKIKLREITNYGFAAFLSKASMKLIGQTDLIIVGILLSVSSVREYSVGAMLVLYSGTFLVIIGNTFFPSIQIAVARNDSKTTRWLFIRQTRISITFGIPAFIGIAMFSKPFIHLWMFQPGFDEESVIMSAGVMTILALAKLPLSFVSSGVELLAATGRIWTIARIAIAEAILNVLLSILFVMNYHWGIYGIAASTLFATLPMRAFWIPILSCREASVGYYYFIRSLLFPSFFLILGFAFICYIVQRILPPDTWFIFSLDVFLVLLFFLLLGVPALLPKEFRQKVFNFRDCLRFRSNS